MKYIDAEKLKKIVEQAKQRALKGAEVDEDMYCDGRADAFGQVLLEIDSLQQDQPEKYIELNGIKYRKVPAKTNDKICKDCDYFLDNGMCKLVDCCPCVDDDTILERLQEQPEVDLEEFTKKMDAWKSRYNHPDNIPIKAAMAFTARMFYQYPNVARQWYESLPKATMDNTRKEE